MNKEFEKLTPFLNKSMAFNSALSILTWDNETTAPPKAIEYTANVIGTLSNEYFASLMNDEVKTIIKNLSNEIDNKIDGLTNLELGILKELKKNMDKLEYISPKDYKAYAELTTKANSIWAKAKEDNSYEQFAPSLREIIAYNKKFATARANGMKHPYNVLLEDFEEGFTMEVLDNFFEVIKKEIVPLLKEVSSKNTTINKDYNNRFYNRKNQKEFSKWLADYLGFNFEKGVIAESEHPFTLNLHNHDVRITSHYYEDNLESAIFSTIHEAGHGIYEQGIMDELTQTLLGEGTSMGFHESQSRFYENIIGRSYEFWKPIYPKLQDTFSDSLKDISLDNFIKGINKAEKGLIRIEADELSYCLHIMVRYEVEKMIFNNEVTVEELPKVWNDKYEEYLGIRPSSDTEGILQDVHWSWGEFGYFPSYAIGNAIAAQIYAHMKKAVPFEEYLINGDMKAIKEYLGEHIHKYGKTKNTNELLTNMTGEEFNVEYYVSYLKEKYKRIYEL